MEIDKSLLPAESLGWRGLLTLMESSGVAAFIFSIWIVIVFDAWVCGWTMDMCWLLLFFVTCCNSE